MTITIKSALKDSRSQFFVFDGKPLTLPPGDVTFRNKIEAAEAGYYAAMILLESKDGAVQSVRAFQHSGRDCLEVTLRDDLPWNPAFTSGVISKLTQEFVKGGVPLYRHPGSSEVPANFLDKLNHFIDNSKADVFKTIRADGGIKAIGWRQLPEIQAHFEMSGNCASKCLKGDTSMTRSSVKTAFRSEFPFITDFVFIAAP